MKFNITDSLMMIFMINYIAINNERNFSGRSGERWLIFSACRKELSKINLHNVLVYLFASSNSK